MEFTLIDMAFLGGSLLVAVGVLLIHRTAGRWSESKRRDQNLHKHLEALRFLDQMMERYPGRSSVFWEKGKIYEAMGMPEEALRYYQIAQSNSPTIYSTGQYLTTVQRLRKTTKTPEIAVV